MFADYKRKLITDSRQDWTLISAIESSGYTNIQISRALDTCDPMDYHITVIATLANLLENEEALIEEFIGLH